jgi:hypothetical protein
MTRVLTILLLVASISAAQDTTAVPEKLHSLKASYEAAVQRATAPLTKTYIQELQKLKTEYTKAGNLQAALAAEALLRSASDPAATPPAIAAGDAALSKMDVEQFKAWLSTVVITEQSGFKNRFVYDGKVLTSEKDGNKPRAHTNVSVEVGKIFVPFTSTNATITIDDSRSKAEVSYSTGEKLEARIEPKQPPGR